MERELADEERVDDLSLRTLADIVLSRRPAIESIRGSIEVIFTEGVVKEIKVDVLNPLEFQLGQIYVGGIELVSTPSLLGPQVEKRYRIPYQVIRNYSRRHLVLESTGFQLVGEEIRGRRKVKIYIAKPSLLGSLLLTEEAKKIVVAESRTAELDLAFMTLEHAERLAKKSVRLTTPALIKSELQTPLLPPQIGEADIQEHLREEAERKLGLRRRR